MSTDSAIFTFDDIKNGDRVLVRGLGRDHYWYDVPNIKAFKIVENIFTVVDILSNNLTFEQLMEKYNVKIEK